MACGEPPRQVVAGPIRLGVQELDPAQRPIHPRGPLHPMPHHVSRPAAAQQAQSQERRRQRHGHPPPLPLLLGPRLGLDPRRSASRADPARRPDTPTSAGRPHRHPAADAQARRPGSRGPGRRVRRRPRWHRAGAAPWPGRPARPWPGLPLLSRPPERRPADEDFTKDRTQAEHVGPLVDPVQLRPGPARGPCTRECPAHCPAAIRCRCPQNHPGS